MPTSMLFEDFSQQLDPLSPGQSEFTPNEVNTNELHRAGFEDGYKEGWVDAQAAAQSEGSELSAEIATALQEASFAYFEARQHIFNSMRPLLEAMVEQVIPALAKDALPMKIVDELQTLADQSEPPMQILCAPETAKPLKDVLESHVNFPVEVKTEDTLTETQAVLKFTEGQATIDLSAIVDGLRTSLSDFYDLNQAEVAVNE